MMIVARDKDGRLLHEWRGVFPPRSFKVETVLKKRPKKRWWHRTEYDVRLYFKTPDGRQRYVDNGSFEISEEMY